MGNSMKFKKKTEHRKKKIQVNFLFLLVVEFVVIIILNKDQLVA